MRVIHCARSRETVDGFTAAVQIQCTVNRHVALARPVGDGTATGKFQRAGADRRVAGIRIGPADRQRAAAALGQHAITGDGAAQDLVGAAAVIEGCPAADRDRPVVVAASKLTAAIDLKRSATRVDRGVAAIGVRAAQRQRAGPILGQPECTRDLTVHRQQAAGDADIAIAGQLHIKTDRVCPGTGRRNFPTSVVGQVNGRTRQVKARIIKLQRKGRSGSEIVSRGAITAGRKRESGPR